MPPPRELTDDYRLEKILASSRGGSILRGRRLDTGEPVAIKLINLEGPADPSAAAQLAARFCAYAEALASLRHPNLPVVLDSGTTQDGGAFLVMELLLGVGFEVDGLAGGAAPDRILPLLIQALDGLEELARHGLAHLNLCPGNLFLVPAERPAPAVAGGPAAAAQTVKLLGLGTALFHLGEAWTEGEGSRFRAPELASPEAARQGVLDWRADSYALALTACNALGATVASGEVAGALVQTVQMPLALSFELANDEALRKILERCLRQAPAERPAPAAIRDAFSLAVGGVALPPPAGPDEAEEPETTAGTLEPRFEPADLSAGSDSLLDLFDVPDALPGLPDLEELPDEAGTPFGPRPAHGFAAHQAARDLELGLDDDAEEWRPRPAVTGGAPAPAATGASGRPSQPAAREAFPTPVVPPPTPPTPRLEPGPARPPLDAVQEIRIVPPPALAAAVATGQDAGARATAPSPATGDQLPAVDELLSSLPPPPPLAAPPAAAAHGAGGAPGRGWPGAAGRPGGAAAAAQAPHRSEPARIAGGGLLAPLLGLPRPVLLGGAGALLLAAAVAAYALVGHLSRQPSPTVRAATAGVDAPAATAGAPPRIGRSAAAKFFDARSYLIFGRDGDQRVRQALRELSFAEQGELGPRGCAQLGAMQQTLAAAALETVQQDLAGGLRKSDLGTLQSVVEVASDGDVPPGQRSDLERARSLVKLYQAAQAAAAAGDPGQVLDQFRAIEGLSRTLHDPLGLRDQAAAALEADAVTLARDGRYDEAVGRLGPIVRSWPERAGVKDLVKTYETAAASEPQQLAILDSVPTYESRRKPSEALDLLRPLQPTPHLEPRIAEARQRLQAQLAQLDAQPPQVSLRPGYPLDYSRGAMISLSFRVTDDYEVKSVKLFARPEGGRLRELRLQKSSFGWDAEIPPSFHQNGTVEFFVVATDLSGHEGTLGSKENPLRLKRRQGFQQLLH